MIDIHLACSDFSLIDNIQKRNISFCRFILCIPGNMQAIIGNFFDTCLFSLQILQIFALKLNALDIQIIDL